MQSKIEKGIETSKEEIETGEGAATQTSTRTRLCQEP